MSFLKQRFAKNNCRLCKKTFCCEKCRAKHETSRHNVFPDCDICIYGKLYISLAPDTILEHIQQTHWPLNCVHCKHLFATLNELSEHNKCPMAPQLVDSITKTPLRSMPAVAVIPNMDPDNFCSPPINFPMSNIIIKVLPGTSTPMQAGEKMLDCFPDNITPVDNERREITKNKIMYANDNLTPNINDDNKKTDNYNKRKVTFNETPLTEHTRKKPITGDSPFLKGSLKKPEPLVFNFKANISLNITDVVIDKSANIFVTADSKALESISESHENGVNECIAVRPKNKRRSSTMNETLWESAINYSMDSPDLSIVAGDQQDLIKVEPVAKRRSYSESNTHEFGSNTNIDSHYSYIDNACGSYDIDSISDSPHQQPGSIWTSMAHMMKGFVKGFSGPAMDVVKRSSKRHWSDTDDNAYDAEVHQLKRIKLTDIKCRPSIRTRKWLRPVEKVDKATQTDDL